SLDTPWTAIRTAALADAKTVLVGWRYTRWNPRVKTWPPPRILQTDTVVFKWNDWLHKHNVVAISAARFSTCHFGSNGLPFTVLTKASKHGTLKLSAGSSSYTGYFTSSVGNDCLRGMKVDMQVELVPF
ncbi:unnamed protein product, partial [Closterium sp. Naga37s-1]